MAMESQTPPGEPGAPWQEKEKTPTFKRPRRAQTTFNEELVEHRPCFPWAGIVALLSIIFLTGSSVVILLASNHSPITRWQWKSLDMEPQVWLSILSTLMDGLTMFSFANGVAILYWKCVNRGTSLRDMYDLFESQAFFGAVDNLIHRRFNYVAITALLCTVSALRGPLFQYASSVDSEFVKSATGTHEVRVAQTLPPSYLYPHHYLVRSSCDFVYDLHVANMPIYIKEDICGKKDCVSQGKVKGYGFDIKCSNSSIPWDDAKNSTVRRLYQNYNNRDIEGLVPVFNTSARVPGWNHTSESSEDLRDFLEGEERGSFEVTSLYKTEPRCGGSLSITKCTVHHAIVEYNIEISDNVVKLASKNWEDDKVITQIPSWNMFNETDLLNTRPLWGATAQWSGLYWQQFNQELSVSATNASNFKFISNHDPRAILTKSFINDDKFQPGNCSLTFRDPTHYTLGRLRELAFRTAVAAANNVTDTKELFSTPQLHESGFPLTTNWTQTIDAVSRETLAVYTVHYPYLIVGVLVSLLAVVAIGPLYWGWSEVYGPTSFNPLEVARAWDAPLMRGMRKKNMEKHVRRQEGVRRVKYCAVEGTSLLRVQWVDEVKGGEA